MRELKAKWRFLCLDLEIYAKDADKIFMFFKKYLDDRDEKISYLREKLHESQLQANRYLEAWEKLEKKEQMRDNMITVLKQMGIDAVKIEDACPTPNECVYPNCKCNNQNSAAE